MRTCSMAVLAASFRWGVSVVGGERESVDEK